MIRNISISYNSKKNSKNKVELPKSQTHPFLAFSSGNIQFYFTLVFPILDEKPQQKVLIWSISFLQFVHNMTKGYCFICHFTDDPAQHRLEELECTDYLHTIRQTIPKISDLSSRLKTKLVQDPLVLDSQGNLLEEESVLRSVVSRPKESSKKIWEPICLIKPLTTAQGDKHNLVR